MAALGDDQEKELTVVALIVTNSLTFSTMQFRSVWQGREIELSWT